MVAVACKYLDIVSKCHMSVTGHNNITSMPHGSKGGNEVSLGHAMGRGSVAVRGKEGIWEEGHRLCLRGSWVGLGMRGWGLQDGKGGGGRASLTILVEDAKAKASMLGIQAPGVSMHGRAGICL